MLEKTLGERLPVGTKTLKTAVQENPLTQRSATDIPVEVGHKSVRHFKHSGLAHSFQSGIQ